MKTLDILECFIETIESKIRDEWKHDVCILGYSSEHINFEIDNNEYVIKISDVKEEEHWSEKLKEREKDA